MAAGLPTDTLGDGRYELDEVLGTGGMGVVLAARDTLLQRRVAVKLLGDDGGEGDEERARFAREARAAARLSHPNVISIYDVGEHGGRPFLVMELVEGPTLAERLDHEGPLPPDEVAAVARDALAGVAAAHAAGVLHRDLKPGNLMERRDGRVLVTDFGIAHAREQERLTRTGLVVGTLNYLAPERRRGDDATPQSDLYALGVTLGHLLTGTPPVAPPEPDGLPTGTPPGLRLLLLRCLAPSPEARPPSAAAALELLDDTAPDTVQATTPLPAGTATVPLGPEGGPDTQDDRDADSGHDRRGSELRTVPAAGSGARRWGPWAAGAAALTLLLVLALLLLVPDGGGGVEITEDPAETARNLADWLRARGG